MANEKTIPAWLWVTTPALLVAFIAAMFFLSSIPASNELDAVQGEAKESLQTGIDRAIKKIEKEQETEKPKYEFYKLLENQTVEVPDIEEYRSTPKDAEPVYEYRLQAGSFRNLDDAGRLRSQLLLEGLPAYQQSSSINGSTWHRVFVGPFTNRSKLNKAQDILVGFNISPIVRKTKINEG